LAVQPPTPSPPSRFVRMTEMTSAMCSPTSRRAPVASPLASASKISLCCSWSRRWRQLFACSL